MTSIVFPIVINELQGLVRKYNTIAFQKKSKNKKLYWTKTSLVDD